ncbi:MAG TPA: hypothetical protein VGC65_03065 [Bacteroidia bacterium]|jgi:hypothetical protein
MSPALRSFFIRLSLFSVLTAIIVVLWQNYAVERFQTNMTWPIWGFFLLVTTLLHFVLIKAAEESPRKFVVLFMASTGIKLFTYLIIILLYALLKREAALGFVLFFLVMYFFYTVFEVITLLKHFRK